ncbi:hypothetical protein ISF6_0824 [Piscinibacter sakaiensis]|uniref:Uncharacterized protein n=1 Tax=Piscinibacter sakaiensis TaxID=1547922 RepID=A0A0K8NXY4_PISS1|nr:hypothetical protein ISF6_0824 [Piscinibacter sakaiensis]
MSQPPGRRPARRRLAGPPAPGRAPARASPPGGRRGTMRIGPAAGLARP